MLSNVSNQSFFIEILRTIQEQNFGITFTDNSLPPPFNATCMGVTRLHYLLDGHKDTETCYQNKSFTLSLKPKEWLYTMPRGWTKPDWRCPQKTLGVVFHNSYIRYLYFEHDGSFDRQENRISPDNVFHTTTPMPFDGFQLLKTMNAFCLNSERHHSTHLHLMKALLEILIDELQRPEQHLKPTTHHRWEEVLAYLDEHSHLPINRSLVASEFGMHPNSLSRLFTLHDQESFQECLTRYRVERACRLLTEQTLKLELVAKNCGFSNANYFNKAFKKYQGETAGQYRQRFQK